MASIDNQHIDNIDSQCKIITVISFLALRIMMIKTINMKFEKKQTAPQSLPQRIGVMAKKPNVE